MFILDLLFPKFCLGCGYIGVYLCPSCLKKLEPVKQDVCLYCKKPSLLGLTHVNCGNKLNVDGMITIYRYNPMLKIIIKNIKYRLAVQVWNDFYKMISPEVISKLDCYKNLPSDLVIQPIPLSKNKFNERGFNQASFIGTFFQKFLHFPIVNLLTRNTEVPAQAQIKNKKGRYLNTKGIFTATQGVNPNVILVDDIITSGSTVKEAAKILKRAGAKKVYVLALAMG
ncbi:MAG: ComF family protein [Candidatus Roizmanbacteria bacterium]|nr:ComF family protein [Candidatus Roizmanbacteria bacterium]MCR4312682.1 ComF family protein [Candidatus Roizmanbacteria bacterium]